MGCCCSSEDYSYDPKRIPDGRRVYGNKKGSALYPSTVTDNAVDTVYTGTETGATAYPWIGNTNWTGNISSPSTDNGSCPTETQTYVRDDPGCGSGDTSGGGDSGCCTADSGGCSGDSGGGGGGDSGGGGSAD